MEPKLQFDVDPMTDTLMFNEALTTEDFSTICRICLQQYDADTMLVLEKVYLFSGEIKLMDILMKYTVVEENEAYPEHICSQCVLRAEEAYCFFEKCNESDSILEQISQNMEEIDDEESDIVDVSQLRSRSEQENSKFEIITIKNEDREDVEIKIIFDSNDAGGNCEIDEGSQNEYYSDTDKFSIDHAASSNANYLLTEKCSVCHLELSLKEFQDHKLSLGHFEESDTFICPHCTTSTKNITSFRKHLRTHSTRESKTYTCEMCGKVFKWNKNYTEHLKTHNLNEEEKVMCPECGLLLANVTSLQIHRVKEHAQVLSTNEEWNCRHCLKVFDQIADFKKHLKEIHAEKDFHCIICGKDCEDKRTLYYHEQLHLDEFGIECDYCHKKLLTEEKLILHQRIHKYVTKKHVCEICNKGFKQIDKLEAHVRVHTGEKPFICTFCDKAFNHQNNLQHHIRLHTGDTPYKCLFCSKEFSNSHSLRKHMSRHDGERSEGYISP